MLWANGALETKLTRPTSRRAQKRPKNLEGEKEKIMTTNLDALREFVHTNMPERLAGFDGFLLRYKGLHHDDDVLLLIEAMGWNAIISERIPSQLGELVTRAETVAGDLQKAADAATKTALTVCGGLKEIDQSIAGAIADIDTSELAQKFMGEVASVLARGREANDLLVKNIETAHQAEKLMTRSFVIGILLAGLIVGLLAGWQLPRVLAQNHENRANYFRIP
jgi:hypothetical protein